MRLASEVGDQRQRASLGRAGVDATLLHPRTDLVRLDPVALDGWDVRITPVRLRRHDRPALPVGGELGVLRGDLVRRELAHL